MLRTSLPLESQTRLKRDEVVRAARKAARELSPAALTPAHLKASAGIRLTDIGALFPHAGWIELMHAAGIKHYTNSAAWGPGGRSTVALRHGKPYGQPLQLPALQHAPVNEVGVILLFGMLCEDLGFVIETSGPGFPDCEAKRSADGNGQRWERVRIEFEYTSSNFLRHHHDPDGCDLIVCWAHDWPECPVEVLELRSVIER